MSVVRARVLRKTYRKSVALDGVDLSVEAGRIVGLIGPNGAGKSTALQAITGLIPFEGELSVLGRHPWTAREALMGEACFIADVAVLPRWLRTSQALDYMAGVHPRFDRAKAEGFLARTTIGRSSRVRELSKGMVAQLHLALIMAVDARLLVLDEPTLGLDLLFRKAFYDSLLNDYFDGRRTIVVSTHDVAEVEHILSDVVFLDRGKVVLDCSMEAAEARFVEASVGREHLDAGRALRPIHERRLFDRTLMLFDGVERERLIGLGELRTPSLSDLFVALMSRAPVAAEKAAA